MEEHYLKLDNYNWSNVLSCWSLDLYQAIKLSELVQMSFTTSTYYGDNPAKLVEVKGLHESLPRTLHLD